MKRSRRTSLRRICTVALTAVGLSIVYLPGSAMADPGVSEREARWLAEQATQPSFEVPTAINPGASALQIAQAIAANPAQVTGAAFVAKPPMGTPTAVADSGTPLSGFPLHGTTYGILTTGNANLAPTANSSGSSGADNGGLNVRGTTDFDVTILRIDLLVPAGVNCVSVGYFKFLSEEYPEFVGTQYNDAFIAELDVSNWSTSGSTITAPNNFAFDPSGNTISINAAGATSMSAAQAAGTTYDGATPTLIASTPVTAGPHSIYFSIFDQGDRIYDSAVFLDNLSLRSVTPGTCVSGALAPLTTSKTADASQSTAGTTNGYTITISNPNSSAVTVSSIFDNLPAGFTYQAGSTTGVTTANPAISGQTLTWNGSFSVPANGSISLRFRVTVANAPGTYFNTAGGSAGTVNVNSAVNVAPITVVAKPLTTSKVADAPSSSAGGTNGYTITISNPNAASITVTSIFDDLPAGFTYQVGSTTGVTTANPAISGQRLTWNGSFPVPANSSISLRFRVTVSFTPGTYFNSAGGTATNAAVNGVVNTAPVTVRGRSQIVAEPAVVNVDTRTPYLFNLTARLTDGTTGAPLVGRTVTFSTDGAFVCSGITNPNGVASCTGSVNADVAIVLALGYTATFAGDALYDGSTDDGPIVRVLGIDVLA